MVREYMNIIHGHNHLDLEVGLNISCLHRTETVMPMTLQRAPWGTGVFFGCVRGKSAVTGKTRVHSWMVYVIEGDIFLLLQTALKDLGVIPKTFPLIGEFGGEEQEGDGHDKFEVDNNYDLRYIATGSSKHNYVLQGDELGEIHHGPQLYKAKNWMMTRVITKVMAREMTRMK